MEWWVIECFESSANFRINIPPPFYSSCSWCSDDLATSNTEKHVSLLCHKNRPHLQLPPASSSTKTKIMFSKLREEKLEGVVASCYMPQLRPINHFYANCYFKHRLFNTIIFSFFISEWGLINYLQILCYHIILTLQGTGANLYH